MCETNDDAVSVNTTEQQTQETFGEETVSQQANSLVKFDIGQFVHNQRKILLLVGPWIRLYNTVINIIGWRSPYVSLVWLILCCIFAVKSPVFFIIMPLAYITIIMALSGIKKRGVHENKRLKHSTIKKKADNNDLNVKATVEKQVQEDIKEFITLLVHLEALSEWISQSLDNINRILKWEDFKASSCILAGLFVTIVVLLLVPLTLILPVAVLSLFCLNLGFRPVAMQVAALIRGAMESLMVLVGLRGLFRSKRQLSSTSFNDLQDEWYDAQSEKRAEQSSDEEGSDDDMGSSISKKKLDSSSILSQLADYRRKQKKLNSGKCHLCDVPFTSILKKRQYCRHCGESFCSKCCSHRVKRSVFGATAPAAYEETVLVCKACFDLLMNVNTEDQPGPPW